jgi:hypothetical protein
MKSITSLLSAVLLFPALASAAVILDFSFDNSGADIDETSPWTKTNTFDAGLAPFGSGSSGLVAGSGFTPGSQVDAFRINAPLPTDLSSAVSTNGYLSFTLAPVNALSTIDLDSVELNYTSNGQWPACGNETFNLFSSVDGFASAANVIASGSNSPNNTITLSFPDTAAYNAISGPVELRIYVEGNTTAANGFIFENATDDLLRVNGSVTVVP